MSRTATSGLRAREPRAASGAKRADSVPTATPVVLDHLAVAVNSWSDPAEVLAVALGGKWKYGLRTPAFNPCQIAYGNDTRIELLAPPDQGSSFVTKFLASGKGKNRPHHITFKTNDITAILEDAERFGLEPVLVSLENRRWREAFLHPRDTGLGVLIQIAQSDDDPATQLPPDLLLDCPWTEPAEIEPATISYITVCVRDPESAAQLFCEVLHGERLVDTDSFVRVQWPSGADLVLFNERLHGGATPSPLGVRSIGIDTAAPSAFTLAPAGMAWSRTPVVPELGVSLLFNSVPISQQLT